MTTPEATRRARANKRKGARFQSEIRDMLRSYGLDTEILELSGQQDEGDLIVRLRNGRYIVIEAKNEQKIDLPGYLRELDAERANYVAHRAHVNDEDVAGVVVVKARGKGVEDAYVVERFSDRFRREAAA